MARKLTRREWSMLGLVALLGVAALYLRDPEFHLGRTPEKAEDALDLGPPPVVNLAKLERTGEGYDGSARNLFEYYTPPPPKRPQPAPPKPVAQRPTPPPPPRPAQRAGAQDRTPPRPQPPRISFDYLGFLGPKTNRIAVFEDGDEVFIARAGDVVREQFRVVEFQYEKLIMGYTDERFQSETTELEQKKSRRRR